MPIEGTESTGAVDAGASPVEYNDVGAGAMNGDSPFSLPEDFDQNIDDGIEIPASDPRADAGQGQQPPAQPPAGQTPPAQQQQPAAPAPQQPVVEQQPIQQQPTGSQPADGRVFTPSELATQLSQNRQTMIDALAAQKFQLSPAEIQALEVDAVGVLPKLMARVYFDATVNGLQQLANMVPRMVEHVANERIAESKAESDFHTAWPNIDPNNPDHMRTVIQLSTSFRAMNPSASMADAIKYVGMAATSFLGLQMPVRGGNGQRAAAPAQRGRSNPPFAPAQGGRAQPPAGSPMVPADPFSGLGTNFDE